MSFSEAALLLTMDIDPSSLSLPRHRALLESFKIAALRQDAPRMENLPRHLRLHDEGLEDDSYLASLRASYLLSKVRKYFRTFVLSRKYLRRIS